MFKKIVDFIFNRVLNWNYPPSYKDFLGFLYFFFVITSYYIIKPLRASKFLGELGAEMVPYFYLLNCFLIFFIIFIYNKIVDHFGSDKRKLLLSANYFLVANIFFFSFAFYITKDIDIFSRIPYISSYLLGLFEFKTIGLSVTILFYIWASFFAVFAVSLFWSLMSDIYTTEEGKGAYGFIGLGGVLGGAFGGIITETSVKYLGHNKLLFLSALLLGTCIFIIKKLFIMKHSSLNSGPVIDLDKKNEYISKNRKVTESKENTDIVPEGYKEEHGLSLIINNAYVRVISLTVLLMTLGGTLFDFQLRTLCQKDLYKSVSFNEVLSDSLDKKISFIKKQALVKFDNQVKKDISKEILKSVNSSFLKREEINKIISTSYFNRLNELVEVIPNLKGMIIDKKKHEQSIESNFSISRTQFFAWLFKTISIVSFLIQIFLTSRLHKMLGIALSLSILPFMSFIGVSATFAFPMLSVIAWSIIFQNGASYSLMQSTREQLYIPVNEGVKYKAKSFIDTFVFRFGDALASILILIVSIYLKLPLRYIAGINFFIILAWVIVVLKAGKMYNKKILQN